MEKKEFIKKYPYRIAVDLHPEIYKKYRVLAALKGKSMSKTIRESLQENIEKVSPSFKDFFDDL